MAKLKLTLYDVNCIKDSATGAKVTQQSVSVSTEMDTDKITITREDKDKELVTYQLSLTDLSFVKKMYQPTEVVATLQIARADGNPSQWVPINRNTLQELFIHKKVSIEEEVVDDKGKTGTITIGDDYYVHQIQTHYKPQAMYCTLNIYSPDKLLTLNQVSRTFVAKRLRAEILTTEMGEYKLPWDKKVEYDKDGKIQNDNRKSVAFDASNMQVLAYGDKEHIFPYLVQYNESFYDLLARTTNRWGEFLYYEDGKLQVGYKPPKDAEDVEDMDGLWQDVEYCDDGDTKLGLATAGNYAHEAPYDTNVLNKPFKKDPLVVKNVLGCSIENGMDAWIIKKFAAFFANTKSIPEWLGGQIFDEVYDQITTRNNVKQWNGDFNKTYFEEMKNDPTVKGEQYGSKDPKSSDITLWNPFSELNSKYDGTKYAEVLLKEIVAGRGAVRINFNTTWPDVRLGQIIKVLGSEYIVTEVTARREGEDLVFHVTALPKDKDGKFYPAKLPTGHIRTSGPQVATVTDADDPLKQNRVRIMFPWQKIDKDDDGKPTDATKKASSPWLVFASSAASKKNGIQGQHHEGDVVLVNFAFDNVERPFIAGGLATEGNDVPMELLFQSVALTSPGSHYLKLNDGSGAGLTAFLAGTFLPAYNLVTTFAPVATYGKDIFKGLKTSPRFEGGFELGDKYGMYKITGSTDKRNISIASPWGNVKIDAFTGISINAPNGDVSIKGKNVTIEAGNNLKLVSGSNVNYKLAQKKDTVKGSIGTAMSDVLVAVAKKLAEKMKLIDLSLIRAAVEVVMRPMEGALVVKSNRFLKLEAGKGSCSYPVVAYKDQAAIEKMHKETEKSDLRPGLKLSAGVVELLRQCRFVADEISEKYIANYNACYDRLHSDQDGLLKCISDGMKWSNDADAQGNATICKTYDQLKDTLWADGKKPLKEDDLGFTAGYKAGGADDVTDDCVNRILRTALIRYPDRNVGTNWAKNQIIAQRKLHRKKILEAANRLRNAIIELGKMQDMKKMDFVNMMDKLRSTPPDGYKDIFGKAFEKDKLDTGTTKTFFYKPVTSAKKSLTEKYGLLDLGAQSKILSRRAAILVLEGLGFKDDWRDKGENGQTIERPWSDATILLGESDKWTPYVNSINSVPKLSSAKAKILAAALEQLKSTVDGDNFKAVFMGGTYKENKAWSEGKNGGILFSNGGGTFQLGSNIQKVQGAGKERLTTADDMGNNEVNEFLENLRNALKAM